MSIQTWFRMRITVSRHHHVAHHFEYTIHRDNWTPADRLLACLPAQYAWREQLQGKLHDTYFADGTFYRQTTWANAIPDPGQRITRDIQMLVMELRIFCTSMVSDILMSSQACWRIYWEIPEQRYLIPLIFVWTCGNLTFRNWFSPALERGMLTAKSSRLYGVFRDSHSKLSANAESIINFGGVGAEAQRLADRLDDTLNNSKRLTMLFLRERFTMSLSGEVVSQTITSCLIQLPVISPSHRLKVAASATEAARMQANADMLSEMAFNGQLIRNLQMQIGHVSRLGRALMQMAGNAIRIAELLDLVEKAEGEGRPVSSQEVAALYFKDVNVETPTGVRLVDNLSLTVTKGQSLVVCGANGVGKTSIFRTLKGLWGTAGGQAAYPKNSTLFLPQTPYCPLGSLQDQLTYPVRAKQMPVEELRACLAEVNLAHLVEKSSADSEMDWNTLSLGERQQLAVGRVLFQEPSFAVLDEATSAIDADVEATLFEKLKRKGVTLVTVTHRASLLKFHENVLKIKGADGDQKRSWSVEAVQPGDENDFASPRKASVNRQANAQADIDAEVARCLADRTKDVSAPKISQKPMPKGTDLSKLIKLVKLCVPRLTLTDESVLRMLGYTFMMGASVYIQTGVLSTSYGILNAFTMQSDRQGYIRFTVQIMGVRMLSLLVGVAQQWLQMGVSILWRGRLTQAITARYLAHNNFYIMKHVDRRITDVDSRITQEVMTLVQSMSQMTQMVIRPIFDTAYCTVLLIRVQMPWNGIMAMFAYAIFGIGAIGLLAPDFRGDTSMQERLTAEFRSAHARVESNAEAIAFQDGGALEKDVVDARSNAVMEMLKKQNTKNQLWSVINTFMMWRAPYYIQQYLQLLWSQGEGTDKEVLADRGGTQMAETSAYVGSVISQSFMALTSTLQMWGGWGGGGGQSSGFAGLLGNSRRVGEVLLVLDELDQERERSQAALEAAQQPMTPRRGERMCVTDVNINAPDGRCLARDLSFSVESGGNYNLLITGGNGTGKSAVARVLSGMWQPGSGLVGTPKSGVAVVPQAPLVPTAAISLLDMMTYPRQLAHGSTEEAEAIVILTPMMQQLRVAYLIERNDECWAAIQHWAGVLSMGEQQCLGILRALYHKPRWAVLDEATSAMPEDVAVESYKLLQSRNINFVSVSQSVAALRPFHGQELRLGEANATGFVIERLEYDSEAFAKQPLGDGSDTGTDDTSGTDDLVLPRILPLELKEGGL